MEVFVKKRKVYISGPMTGLPDHNFPAFNAAATDLRNLGFCVFNPAEISVGKPNDYETSQDFYHACLRADVKGLCDCDTLALMPGWENSSGAHLELHIAHRLGVEIFNVADLLKGVS